MEIRTSPIPFFYTTIVVTRSRIEKGLLAIPASISNLFPQASGRVYLLNEVGEWVGKTFTAYDSRSKEVRIGGMRDFYQRYGVQHGDQLVLHVHDSGRYELLPEKLVQQNVLALESRLENALTEAEADSVISELAAVTHASPNEVLTNEFVRLAHQTPSRRRIRVRRDIRVRDHIPPSLRKILLSLYHGRCQVSGFSFSMRTGDPYFEVHHLDPNLGNHPKNVLVVSPNVHAQFTWAEVEESFDDSGWLRDVKFNGESHRVFQIVGQLPAVFQKAVHAE